MLQSERDEALGQTQRNEALSRCTRDLQHLGDFVLRVTGDEIEPAGPRGLVQTRLLVIGCCHLALLIRSPKIRHSPEHPIGTRLVEDGFAVTRLIVTASDKSPNR